MACAAVLLTAFEDEALLAVATSQACAAPQSAPKPDQTDELSLFPDLSPSRSDRLEIDGWEAGSQQDSQFLVGSPSQSGRDDRWPARSGGPSSGIRRSLHSMLCIWQV